MQEFSESSSPSHVPHVWFEINVLGTFEVIAHIPRQSAGAGDTSATPSPIYCRPNTSLLLACLALYVPRLIPRDSLVTWLYPDVALDAGRHQLSQALYRLRAELEAAFPHSFIDTKATPEPKRRSRKSFDAGTQIVIANPDVVGLKREAVVVDVLLFQQEAKSARLDDWLRAIHRFRGDLMPELELEWANPLRSHLHATYERLLEQACTALIRAERLPEAVVLTQRWIAADEFNEDAHRAFMQLSARLGRFAVALKHFDNLTKLLWDELKTTPDPTTRSLAQQIRAESQAGWDFGNPTPTHAAALPFVGRRPERAALIKAADDALKANGHLVLLEGESGIGKSRLLENVASGAAWRGLNVVWGHAEQHSAGQLYAPLNQALHNALTSSRRNAIRATLPANVLDILGHFVPALREPALREPASSTPDPSATPLSAEPGIRLLAPTDAIQQLLAALSAQVPHLLILDDVQWADAGFWEAIRVLAMAKTTQPLSIILSYRDDELRANPTAWEAIRELDQHLNLTLVRLAGLSPRECAELAFALGKPVNSVEASHLHEQTHGNPLFIEGLIEGRLPDASFQKQFALKLSLLSPLVRRTLECAAVLGREFTYTVWQAMASPDDVMSGVPALIAARLIHETPQGFGFRHDMLREQVHTAIALDQCRELHRRAASILSAHHAEPNLLALHLEQAGQWHAAIRAYRTAGNQAERANAHASALQHYARAFRLLEHLSPQQARFERVHLLCRRQLVYGMQLKLDDWRADIEELEALAQARNERLSLITAFEARMTLSLFESNPEGTRRAGERALELARSTGRRDVQARIGNILGMHLANLLRQVDVALPLLNASVDYAQSVDDGPLLVSSLCNLSLAQRLNGTSRAARKSAAHALALSESWGAVDAARAARATALHALGCADWALLNWNTAQTSLNQAVREQINLNNLWRAAEALASLAHLHISMGQYANALMATEQLMAVGQSIGVSTRSDVWNWAQAIWADAQTLSGNFEAAGHVVSALEDWLQVTEDSRYALIGLQAKGRWLLEQNQPQAALQTLTRAHHIWQHRKHAELEPVLLYVLAAHRSGETLTAREALTEVTQYYQSGDSQLHEVFLHAVAHEVWGDIADVYAAHDALQVQAGKFLTTALRETFISGVRLHRDVMQRYRVARSVQPLGSKPNLTGVRSVQLARIGVPLGRALTPTDMIDVQWTVDDVGDAQVQRREKRTGLRIHRIQRLAREATEQGAVPTHADLARALSVSVRTIERDVQMLRERGLVVHTRRDSSQKTP